MEWKEFISSEMAKDYFSAISKNLAQNSKIHEIYPPKQDIFNAFDLCPFDKTKVIIIGQDCYHGPNQAHGLSFSVKKGIAIPPSLRNIFKELKDDLGFETPNHGDLTSWAKQGVLLLNSILTVNRGQPGSHKHFGWQEFTDNVIRALNEQNRSLVFMLWGAYARSKKDLITDKKHLILEAAHPSPYSASNGFFGCKHFSKANEFLTAAGAEPVNWGLQND